MIPDDWGEHIVAALTRHTSLPPIRIELTRRQRRRALRRYRRRLLRERVALLIAPSLRGRED